MTDLVVLGANGRIGHLVSGMRLGHGNVIPVTRTDDPVGLDAPGAAAPILVCTRNDDLDAVLGQVHPTRHADLVFVQNGMIRPWLATNGLSTNTRGVLWVTVPRKADPPVPGGASPFSGRWAQPVAKLLNDNGIDAVATDPISFAREEAVKLAWICVYGPLGSATGLRVGALCSDHAADVRELCAELHPLLAHEPGLDLEPEGLFTRLQTYSRKIPHFGTAVKEWRWRNGWQLNLAQRLGVGQPALLRWLDAAGINPSTGP